MDVSDRVDKRRMVLGWVWVYEGKNACEIYKMAYKQLNVHDNSTFYFASSSSTLPPRKSYYPKK
ncbi:hypothetical protein ccbrp13_58090 [Ktedonobacteria bacterium brp13]|nr:hypothetical protein ccbrp13_58090 [Ktedonobacteria bacterium brp13]